jgi:hypothetical protein
MEDSRNRDGTSDCRPRRLWAQGESRALTRGVFTAPIGVDQDLHSVSVDSDANGTKKRRILPADIQSGSPVAASPATCPDRQGAIALRADVIAHGR